MSIEIDKFKVMDPTVRVTRDTKSIRRHSDSGHSWDEDINLDSWTAHSHGLTFKFKKESKADEFAAEQEAFNRRHPAIIPRSDREIAYLEDLHRRGLLNTVTMRV